MTVSPEDIAAARGMVRVSEHRPLRESEAAIIRNVIDGLAGQEAPYGVPRSYCDLCGQPLPPGQPVRSRCVGCRT